MATRNSYADYLKTIPAGAVGANGLLGAPSTGVNYQAEGLTPQQYYDFMTQQVADPMARDGADGGYRDRGPADASWIGGAQKTGAGAEFWGSLAALMGGQALMGGAGAGAGAGMSAAEADAALAAFDASQLGAAGAGVGAGAAAASGGSGAGSAASGAGLLTPAGTGMSAAQADAALAGFDASQASGPLGGVGSWLKENPTLAKIGGAAVGALANSKDTQNTNTQSTDPWSQAQPYLIDNLKTNAAMQEHYRANPFSNEQKTAYQGLLNTVANNSANSAPMMANANNFMQSSRGKMPAMQGLLSGTQAAPIDWSQYANIGRK